MAKNMVFGMAVKAEGELFSRRGGSESQVNVFLVFLRFFRMAAGAIHCDEALPEVEVRIGVGVAAYTEDFSRMVNVLVPFFRINVEGTGSAVAEDLGYLWLAVAKETFLIGIGRRLGKRELAGNQEQSGQDEGVFFLIHPKTRPSLDAELRTFAEMSSDSMNEMGREKEFNGRHLCFPNLEFIPRFKFGIGNMLTQ